MGSLPDTPAAPPVSRFQAQRALGLFAAHDYVMGAISIVGLLACFGYLLIAAEPDWVRFVAGLCLTVIFQMAWLIVLVYRVLVFVLDLHAEVALMPEASARIAVGFLQGKPLRDKAP